MPRRDAPDSLSLAVGQRIKALRIEEGLTIEQLADESKTGPPRPAHTVVRNGAAVSSSR